MFAGRIEEGVIIVEIGQVVTISGLVDSLGGAERVIMDGIHSRSVRPVDRAAIVAPIDQIIPRLIIDDPLHDLLRTRIIQRRHPSHHHLLLHYLLPLVQFIDHVVHFSDDVSSGGHPARTVAFEDGVRGFIAEGL